MFIVPDTYHVDDVVIVIDVENLQSPLDVEDGHVSVFHRNYDWRGKDWAVQRYHFMTPNAEMRLWQSTFSIHFKDGRCDPEELAHAVESLLTKCGYHGRYVEAVKVIDHPEPVEGIHKQAIQVFIGS